MPYVTATLMTIAVFFLALLVFITGPFERLPVPASEGADLNPLLQNYWMMIHPPSLYLGYVGVLGAVRVRDRGARDAAGSATCGSGRRAAGRSSRGSSSRSATSSARAGPTRSSAGAATGRGIRSRTRPSCRGSACTAFLHSVMIQEKKNMLKMWNMVLVLLTFCLTIFGTFLTRSGVVSSVHSFTQSGLGPFFVAFLLAIIAIVIGAWSCGGGRCCAARTRSTRSCRARRRSSSTTCSWSASRSRPSGARSFR